MSVFSERRSQLAKRFFDRGLADFSILVSSNKELIRNDDVHFKFRQDSSFFYLTGFDEPDSVLVLRGKKNGDGKAILQTTLFLRSRNPERELWDGKRLGVMDAPKILGVDEAYSIDEIEVILPKILSFELVVADFMSSFGDVFEKAIRNRTAMEGRSGKGWPVLESLKTALSPIRSLKKEFDLEKMKRAALISSQAHNGLLEYVRPGMRELEIEGWLDFFYKKNGSFRHAYDPIVASGSNGTCLHYKDSFDFCKDGDLLLVDSGCEFEYYASDITRTFCIGKTFSKEQAAIYDLVLSVQKKCVEAVRPAAVWAENTVYSQLELAQGLKDLKIIDLDPKECVESGKIKQFYPHGLGHFLGMDVHDAGYYVVDGQKFSLQESMVMTVEPGLYFQVDDQSVAEKWRGIGVRIEDDVYVGKNGPVNLTETCIKERSEIEKIRGRVL